MNNDHDYHYDIRPRQSGEPEPQTASLGHSMEAVARQTRMRSNYDVQRDETKYMWTYGTHRHVATFDRHHQGEDSHRRWLAEERVKALTELHRKANAC